MADTFFVSQISTEASAAVGIVFPIMSIIQACGLTLGMGSGSLLSIKLGQKKNEEVKNKLSKYNPQTFKSGNFFFKIIPA